MAKIIQRYYWDSCIFLAYLNNEPQRADIIEAHWDRISQQSESKILTAAISIAEVGHLTIEKEKYKLLPGTIDKIDNMWNNSSVLIVETSLSIVYLARDLMRAATTQGWSLKPFDATHLATALWVHNNVGVISEFHTYDDKLFKLQNIVGFPIIEPPDITRQLPLINTSS